MSGVCKSLWLEKHGILPFRIAFLNLYFCIFYNTVAFCSCSLASLIEKNQTNISTSVETLHVLHLPYFLTHKPTPQKLRT